MAYSGESQYSIMNLFRQLVPSKKPITDCVTLPYFVVYFLACMQQNEFEVPVLQMLMQFLYRFRALLQP